MTSSKREETTQKAAPKSTPQRKRLSQSDVPSHSLEQALRVVQAIAENYAYKPAKPLDVAIALNITPTSGQFRSLTGAAMAFGLTTGASNAPEIAITPLGMRIVRPLIERDDALAKQEAFLKPRIFAEFLQKYNRAQLPKQEIARNVLVSMGVPLERVEKLFQLLIQSAEEVGFIKQVKDKKFVDLSAVPIADNAAPEPEDDEDDFDDGSIPAKSDDKDDSTTSQGNILQMSTSPKNNRVFVTHGKNSEIVNQLKELLTFGSFVPVIAAEHETVSKPVPDKVMDDMRSCYAAIIHVGKEIKLLDQEGKEHFFLNQNVLIEIGAAMALYQRKFILLVERGATLPSNLQGLYEVRYEGDRLDYEATMKLLKAFNDFNS